MCPRISVLGEIPRTDLLVSLGGLSRLGGGYKEMKGGEGRAGEENLIWANM